MGLLRAASWAGVLLLVCAAAGPFNSESRRLYTGRGMDIIFVLDVSPSMAGQDMGIGAAGTGAAGKSRLDAARELILEIAKGRSADAIGIVAVGSEAALALPPTVDRRALEARLGALRVGELGDGTALGLGLAVAASRLESGGMSRDGARRGNTPQRSLVVLITDGENNAGAINPETAASLLRDLGAAFYVAGVGSAGATFLDYVDPATGERRTGSFDSRADLGALRRLAAAGGGEFVVASAGDDLAAFFTRLDQDEHMTTVSTVVRRKESFTVPFMAAGFALLAAAIILKRIILGVYL
jgi:Ca-activated chloride channel family protein